MKAIGRQHRIETAAGYAHLALERVGTRAPGKACATLLASEEHELWLSVVSSWEALLLHKKKKLYLGSDPVQWVRFASRSLQEVPLTQDIVVAAHEIELHNDPADDFSQPLPWSSTSPSSQQTRVCWDLRTSQP